MTAERHHSWPGALIGKDLGMRNSLRDPAVENSQAPSILKIAENGALS
jgi:hypothetical protein